MGTQLARSAQSLVPGDTELFDRWSSPHRSTIDPVRDVPVRLASQASSGIHIVPWALPYQKASTSPDVAYWLPSMAEAAVFSLIPV